LDWDQTLVDAKTQEWLPGALDGLRWLRRQKHTVVIHSVRADSDYGRDQILGALQRHKFKFEVFAKPAADLYVDDKAVAFAGSWPEVIKAVRNAS
jgi:ribonuclease HI